MVVDSYDLPPHPKIVRIKQIKKTRERPVCKKSLVMILPILKNSVCTVSVKGLDRVVCGYPLDETEAPPLFIRVAVEKSSVVRSGITRSHLESSRFKGFSLGWLAIHRFSNQPVVRPIG